MKVKIKKTHPESKTPKYAKQFDVGADLTAVSVEFDNEHQICYNLGIAIEPPQNVAVFLFPRSSICKYDLQLANSVGVGDPGYSASYKAVFNKTKGAQSKVYQVGDRVCQLVLVPFVTGNFVEVEELSQSERGLGGFGSSGQ